MITLGRSKENKDWQVLTILILLVLKSFMKNLFITKSSEFRSFLFNWQTSKQYNRIGKHLLLINCKIVSSDATRPTYPKIALAVFPSTLYFRTSKYESDIIFHFYFENDFKNTFEVLILLLLLLLFITPDIAEIFCPSPAKKPYADAFIVPKFSTAPVLNYRRMKTLRCAVQKSTKIKLE